MPSDKTIDLDASWLQYLGQEFEKPYMQQLKQFLQREKQQGKEIYPRGSLIFNALNSCAFDEVKVVILGQDPYHGPGQAHGLSFSVLSGVRSPPSLQNIFKELNRDLGCPIPNHGCLQAWADQGVLLLNTILTVERGNAGSHKGQGWEEFTDAIVNALNTQRENLVFLLWGSHAQNKGLAIDIDRHLVLKSPHPSPFSAHRGFLGNGHFSATNHYLREKGLAEINWQI